LIPGLSDPKSARSWTRQRRKCWRSPRPADRTAQRSEALTPLEGVKEIKRRARVVGVFPNEAAVIGLIGAILADMHDEWQSGERRYLSEGSMAQRKPTSDTGGIAAIDSGE
jgi:putative transposase